MDESNVVQFPAARWVASPAVPDAAPVDVVSDEMKQVTLALLRGIQAITRAQTAALIDAMPKRRRFFFF